MRKEFLNPNFNQNDPISMVICGYENCEKDFNCSPRVRNFYLLHYIIKGEGEYVVKGKHHKLSSGDVFVIYPDDLTSYYATNENNPLTFCWIGFGGTFADKYIKQIGFTKNQYIIKQNNNTFVASVTNCLDYTACHNDNFSQLKLNSCILECFSGIQESIISDINKNSNGMYVKRALSYIEYFYMDAITVKDIADYLNIERSYFYRIFKKEISMTPESFLINFRIKRAKEMINQGYGFSHIASSVGISDIYYFSKLFKKVTGLTPSQYRAQCKNSEHKTELKPMFEK